MFTGKILTTLVAITTAVILLSQLNASSEINPDIYEPFVNYPVRAVLETTCEPDCREKQHHGGKKHHHGGKNHHHGGKKLTGLFPDTVFVSSKNLHPTTVMGTGTNFAANTMAGLNMQASINGQNIGNTDAAFSNFEAASGVVNGVRENYDHKSKGCGCTSSPCGCASGDNGYGQQNTLPSDYTPFDTTAPSLQYLG